LQKLIEEHEAGVVPEGEEEFDEIVGNIFSLKTKPAFQLMEKLTAMPRFATYTHVSETKNAFAKEGVSTLLIYHRLPAKIIGIIEAEDLVDVPDTKRLNDYVRPVPFVSENIHGLELLERLKEEDAPLAVVLGYDGSPVGVVKKEDLIEELIGKDTVRQKKPLIYLEKSVPAEMTLDEFNANFGTMIELQGCTTFEEVMEKTLGRHPEVGDTIFIEPFELIVKATSLFKAKSILIRTKYS